MRGLEKLHFALEQGACLICSPIVDARGVVGELEGVRADLVRWAHTVFWRTFLAHLIFE